MLLPKLCRVLRQCSKRAAKGRQHPLGVPKVEYVHQGDVVPRTQIDFQLLHESADSEPKVVANHHDALYAASVALTQSLYQVRLRFLLVRVEPLLELVENDQHFLARWHASTMPKRGNTLAQAEAEG